MKNVKKIELSIIIVNWNCGQLIIDCIKSLYLHIKDINFEIIVVDNNSTDGSTEEIIKVFPDVVLIKNHTNNLFAKANNQGYLISKGEYVWILNADTKLFENSAKKMISFLSDSKVGAVTCKLLNKDGSIQYCLHRRFPTYFRMLSAFIYQNFKINFGSSSRYLYLDNAFNINFYIEQAAGTSIILKKSVIEKIGGLFDERNFPLFFNDVDLSYRLNKNGYPIMCVCDTAIYHYKSQSIKVLDFYKNKEYYIPSSLMYFN